jgi:hypothetical protein
MQYEPWHYRYVGEEAALEMFQQGLCLEEYLYLKQRMANIMAQIDDAIAGAAATP